MQISLNWLKEYIPVDISPAELADKLELSSVGRAVAINFESSTESVFAFLKETWQAEKNK